MSVQISDRDLEILVTRLPMVLAGLPLTRDTDYENAKRLLKLTHKRLTNKHRRNTKPI